MDHRCRATECRKLVSLNVDFEQRQGFQLLERGIESQDLHFILADARLGNGRPQSTEAGIANVLFEDRPAVGVRNGDLKDRRAALRNQTADRNHAAKA